MDLLLLLHKCIVLRDALEGQLVHEVDLVRVSHVLAHEGLYCEREGGRVEQDLAALGKVRDQTIQHPLEVLGEELVSFVQAEDLALVNVGHLLLHQIKDSAGGGDNEVHLRGENNWRSSTSHPMRENFIESFTVS